MRNLLAFLAALTITFVLVGYFLGWYKISSTRSQEGHHSVQIDIDSHKIGADLESGKRRMERVIEPDRTDEDKKKGEPTKRETATISRKPQ
jgi:hypothetical protein